MYYIFIYQVGISDRRDGYTLVGMYKDKDVAEQFRLNIAEATGNYVIVSERIPIPLARKIRGVT